MRIGRNILQIELTVSYTSTYDIEDADYDAETPEGQLEEDIAAFQLGLLSVGDFDDFDKTVTGRLVEDV